MHEKLLTILMDKDDITWQSILMDLVKSEQMNPWDINVSVLSQKYLETLQKLKQMDFSITGKVVLAAAILLKIKSNRLIGEDLDYLDQLFASRDEDEIDEDFFDFGEDFARNFVEKSKDKHLKLIPKSPQPRKRKVSIYDLMEALQKALDVKKRRTFRQIPPNVEIIIPTKRVDMGEAINSIYLKIKSHFIKQPQLTFNQLIPSESREDKIYTFLPLLHLTTQGKINIHQEKHFGDIEIKLPA